MLAIQLVHMYWTKENRDPESSAERKKYYKPYDTFDIPPQSDIFIQKILFEQSPQGIVNTENRVSCPTKLKEIDIPGIKAFERDDCIEIVWYSLEHGYMPERKGVHRYRISTSQYDRPELRCDTAFFLKKNEAGLLKYNYRYTSSHGQHYEQFYVYVLNTDQLESDSFIKADYTKMYDENAILF
ncbi:MAG: hypothetical protein IKG46_00530 [Solobacterium sp.]|nr:hypothetical protein [Solobacterium sp.]